MFSQNRVWKGKNRIFIEEKTGKNYLNRMTEADIPNGVLWLSRTPSYDIMKKILHLCGILSQDL